MPIGQAFIAPMALVPKGGSIVFGAAAAVLAGFSSVELLRFYRSRFIKRMNGQGKCQYRSQYG